MTNDQTADFLRGLATGIETGSLELGGESFDWSEIKKIKITFKNQESQLMVRTKLKKEPSMDLEMEFNEDEASESEPVNDDNSSYKTIKKRMKRAFKVIHKNLTSNQLPPVENMDLFLRDCVLITGFPGYGDENYPRFLEYVQEVTHAHNQKDLDKLRQAFSGLASLMKDCHDRFK